MFRCNANVIVLLIDPGWQRIGQGMKIRIILRWISEDVTNRIINTSEAASPVAKWLKGKGTNFKSIKQKKTKHNKKQMVTWKNSVKDDDPTFNIMSSI